MADVELVIKIPEEIYKSSQILDVKHKDVIQIPLEVIANGTPLPKGHGRIADIDRMLEEMRATRTYDIPFALERVKPILEADTEIEAPEIEKLQKIEQIIKDHDNDRIPEDYFYIDEIRRVLEDGKKLNLCN